jgi:hypothetical protein
LAFGFLSRHHEFDMKKSLSFAALALAILLSTCVSNAFGAIRSGFDTSTLPANDDGSTGLVNIGFTVNFFGLSFSQLYVNNNGNVTFDAQLGTFTPFDLNSTNQQIIAPFFGDVDTGVGQVVSYGTGTVDGRAAFGVNWVDVGYYFQSVDKLNSFQLVIIDRSDISAGDFDFEFNYDKIEWETGDASDGVDGLGGDSARAGYANGTGNPGTFFELNGSAVNGAFLDSNLTTGLIHNSLNSDVDGRYVFSARNGIINPEPGTVPEPSTMTILGAMSTLAFVLTRARKRRHEAEVNG